MRFATLPVLLILLACDSRSQNPSKLDEAPARPPGGEITLPEMGVRLTVPPGWKAEKSGTNPRRQTQLVFSTESKDLLSVHRMSDPITTVSDARRVIAERMLSTKLHTFYETHELPTGMLFLTYDVTMQGGANVPEVRVVKPGPDPVSCYGIGVPGTDYALLQKICSSMRAL